MVILSLLGPGSWTAQHECRMSPWTLRQLTTGVVYNSSARCPHWVSPCADSFSSRYRWYVPWVDLLERLQVALPEPESLHKDDRGLCGWYWTTYPASHKTLDLSMRLSSDQCEQLESRAMFLSPIEAKAGSTVTGIGAVSKLRKVHK